MKLTAPERKRLPQQEQDGMLWVMLKLAMIMDKHAYISKNAHAYAHAVLKPPLAKLTMCLILSIKITYLTCQTQFLAQIPSRKAHHTD